jgi:hypothetical protein
VETNLLIELIEKITLEPLPFSDNKNLQKLLMLTAIQSHEAKVDRYVSKLENYDHLEIAHNLQEYNKHALTMSIPVEHIVSIERVLDYANKVDIPEVWNRLAKAQLDGLRIKGSIGEHRANIELHFAADGSYSVGTRFIHQGPVCSYILLRSRARVPYICTSRTTGQAENNHSNQADRESKGDLCRQFQRY